MNARRGWERTGMIDPCSLTDARLQLHWAAQAAAAVGRTLLPCTSDFSHHSFVWAPSHRSMVQGVVGGRRPFCSAIRPHDMTLLLLDRDGYTIEEFQMHGRLLDEAFGWLERRCPQLIGAPLDRMLERPVEMPAHPTSEGEEFSAHPSEAFEEIARYYDNADLVLNEVQSAEAGAGRVRCWPHHFDIGTLIAVDPQERGETARTIGVGMVPGDSSYSEPYYYVTPWPYPEQSEFPPLSRGLWHTEGWFGAVLKSTETSAAESAVEQQKMVLEFLHSAINACREMLR